MKDVKTRSSAKQIRKIAAMMDAPTLPREDVPVGSIWGKDNETGGSVLEARGKDNS